MQRYSESFIYKPNIMKNKIPLLILLLMAIHFSTSPATTAAFQCISSNPQMMTDFESSELISVIPNESLRTETGFNSAQPDSRVTARAANVEAPIWPFKPKYNKDKIQRKNTPVKKNRRSRQLQRKNGIGQLPVTIWKEVNNG
jgi:hypothetical protein